MSAQDKLAHQCLLPAITSSNKLEKNAIMEVMMVAATTVRSLQDGLVSEIF